MKKKHIYIHIRAGETAKMAFCGKIVKIIGFRLKIFFFQILWKCRYHILVTFPSHLKKLCSILRFFLKSWIVAFFTHFTCEKRPQTKQLLSHNFTVVDRNFLHKYDKKTQDIQFEFFYVHHVSKIFLLQSVTDIAYRSA